MKKQTAVDLIISLLKEQIIKSAQNKLGTYRGVDYRIGLTKAIQFCEETKEIEKQKMVDFANDFLFHDDTNLTAEQYYNETYQNQKL